MNRIIREARNLLVACLGLLVLATLAGFLSGVHPLFDWFADFRAIYAVCALLPLIAFVRADRRVAAVAALVVSANLGLIARWMPDEQPECAANTSVMSVNAFGHRSDHVQLAALADAQAADVLFVSELTPSLKDRLAARHPDHAWNPVAPGIGLFARHPIAAVEWREAGGRHFLVATLDTPQGPLRVIGAHPPPPVTADVAAARNQTLQRLGEAAAETNLPTVLLGDLNVTMFSPHYAPVESTGLRNVRDGRGVHATWPAKSPLRIPIDHILHSKHSSVCEVQVLPSFGSDHLPLQAGLHLKEPSQKQTFVFSLAEGTRLR